MPKEGPTHSFPYAKYFNTSHLGECKSPLSWHSDGREQTTHWKLGIAYFWDLRENLHLKC